MQYEKTVSNLQKTYDSLEEEYQNKVSNYEELAQAFNRINQLKEQEEQDKAAAKAVDEAIRALPVLEALSKADRTKVEAVRTSYNTLSEHQKTLVTKLKTLEKLEGRMELLNAVTEEEEAAAKSVDEKITNLPALGSLVYENAAQVADARAAYDALSEKAATLVLNLNVLVAAEQRIVALTPKYTLGDVNHDGDINATDALLALQHSVKLIVLENADYDAANVDGSIAVDATDALYILQYSVQLINKFPVEQ